MKNYGDLEGCYPPRSPLFSRCTCYSASFKNCLILVIIIHSKYFFVSDWLKSEFCHIEPLTSKCSKVADYGTVNREDLKTRLSCFGSENKDVPSFYSFHQQEIGARLANNIARTARRQLKGRHLLFGEYLRR